jgi:RND family efflux transporter MFP subunit
MWRPRRALQSALVATMALAAAGCGNRPAASAHEAAGPALESFVVEARRMPLERVLDGVVEAVNRGTVAAQTAGRVAELLYDVNDFVPSGAVVARLRSAEQQARLLQAEAALREAVARETEAQTRFTRISDMYDRKVVAKAQLDEAAANRDAAVSRLVAAKAALTSAQEGVAYTEIRAPYSGIVTQRHVEVGETVAPGTPVMSGVSLESLRVVVDVPQSIAEPVRKLAKGSVEVGGQRVDATRLTLFPQAESRSGTFRARLELPAVGATLFPGTLVKVALAIGESERLLVPTSALVEHGELVGIYTLGDSGTPSLRQLRIGQRTAAEAEVLAGLRAGERVASDPVAAEQRISARGSGR